jgi:two-component system OmpR family response regulator
MRLGALEIDSTAREVWRDGQRVELTLREWALLDALVTRAGRLVAKQDLEALIAGFDGHVSGNTLEVHVYNLRRKLGHEVIHTVRGRGYQVLP